MLLTPFEQSVLNDFQQFFPVQARPFKKVAEILGTDEQTVLSTVNSLKSRGFISRIGPVFSPNTVGASTLAAIAVDSVGLETIAAIVSAFDSVNHNYQREHTYNLWFVVTAPTKEALQDELDEITCATGLEVLALPMLRAFHIDLGFDLNFSDDSERLRENRQSAHQGGCWQKNNYQITARDERVIQVIQGGLPLCDNPYERLAKLAGISTEQFLKTLKLLRHHGVIRRWGVVVRHHELGYRANAMVVWDIPEADIEGVALKLALEDSVTLCYQRPRVLPQWPYSLFCMIHGKDRQTVEACIEALVHAHQLQNIPYEILFSTKRFKQRGARYRKPMLDALSSVGDARA